MPENVLLFLVIYYAHSKCNGPHNAGYNQFRGSPMCQALKIQW